MKKILFIAVLTLVSTLAAWADVTFVARVPNGNTVEAGTRFQVEFELTSTCDRFDCEVQNSGLRLISGPFPSSYMSRTIVNGKSTVTNTTTYTYVLMADKEGTYTLPAAKAVAEGNTYTSNTLTIKALPADPNKQQAQTGRRQRNSDSGSSTSVGKDDILLGLDLSKTTVYEGEALVATLKLYFKGQNVVSIDEMKLPDFEGFTAQKIELGEDVQATMEQYKGSNYRAYPVGQWLLFPQHAGEVKIKQASLSAVAQVYTGRRSFWDDPFNVYQNVKVPVTSPARTVTVKTMPSGKPASYMNAVGLFTIKSELTSRKIKANDAVIYRVTIEGTGNLKYVRDPKPQFPADFEVYDPKSDLQSRTTRAGVTGKRVIEYTIIPRFGGKFTIPELEFSFFNTNSNKYETIRSEAFTLEVEKGDNDNATAAGNADFSGTTQERIKVLGSDIRYLHAIGNGSLKQDEEPLYGTLLFWLWFILPTLIFAALLVVYRRELRLRADEVGQRTRKANKVASRRLKSAAAALQQKQESEFYESVHKAMLGYVADKLNIPQSEMTGESIKEQLAKRNVNEETIRRCSEVLSTCEYARYAPSTDDQAMDKLYEEASETIDQLEKVL